MLLEDITVIIIAQNEELNIQACIESCAPIETVLVVDGGSVDGTVQIARKLGTRVLEHRFVGYSEQYNFGIDSASSPWVLILDADERVTSGLVDAISALQPEDDVTAYDIPRRNFFAGNPIDHGGWSPDRNLRLLKRGYAYYQLRPVHARVELVEGKSKSLLRGALDHYTYIDVSQYITKMNRYTSLEVAARRTDQDPVDSRSRARALYLHLPFKPVVRFVYMFVVRRGFLDGRAGLDVAILSTIYELVTSMKTRYPDTQQQRHRTP